MENEKIFVVVPVYKVEAYLERCIDSILNQTYQNFELILVDDGSPDNCPAICDRYAAEYGNITVIHQENGGLSAARNTGIEYAMKNGDPENDWINFIDSDDFVHPKYLEYLYRAAKEAHRNISCCSWVYTDTSEIAPTNSIVYSFACLTPEEFWCNMHSEAVIAWGKLYRLYLFTSIRYPLGKISEDQFTTYKLLFQHRQISVVFAKLYYYYQSPNSIMRSPWSPRRLDNLEALTEQKEYFANYGYQEAYQTASTSFLQSCVSHLCAMEHTRYDKNAQKVLKKEMYAAFFIYGREFGFVKAFRIWYSQRYIPWSKWKYKHSLTNRAIRKIKRMLAKP